MKIISLNGKWEACGTAPTGEKINICGNVPGSALNDIINSGICGFDDVFYRDNAEQVQKYERYNWVYTKSFNVDSVCENTELVFEKLDTYCDIYLNEKHIAYCENAFISYTFDVASVIKQGENILEVYFYSPITRIEGKKERYAGFTAPRLYCRRPQYSFGWDWTMRFVTCGISGDVYLRKKTHGMQVDNVYVYTKSIDENSAEIGIDVRFKEFEKGSLINLRIEAPSGETIRTHSVWCSEELMRLNLYINNPKLWFPLGYGKQPLYKLYIECGSDANCTEFGIRKVRILQLPDEKGREYHNKCIELKKTENGLRVDKNNEFSGFIVEINGEKILCRGFNWVPCQAYSMGDTKKRITKILELSAKAGVNIIRIWGGGDFECEHFYNECSRLGIMVTQDFMLACGDYPDDEDWFIKHLEKEAEYAIKLIRNKPCLVWWNGDNENGTVYSSKLPEYSGRKAAYKVNAPAVYKWDFTREFLPTSPFGGDNNCCPTVGTTHNTFFLRTMFDYYSGDSTVDYKEFHKQFLARFISEEPIMGVSSVSSLKKFMTDEDIYGDGRAMWYYHSKTNPFLEKELFDYFTDISDKMLGKAEAADSRIFNYQYVQYEHIRITLELIRREKWFSAGIIYWMLNDCWPAANGWSIIDYYNKPKAAYYSFKKSAKAVISSIDLSEGKYKLYVCNDSLCDVKLKAKAFLMSDMNKNIFEKEFLSVKNTSEIVFEIPTEKISENDILFFEIENENGEKDRAFYKHGALNLVYSGNVELTEKCNEYIKVKADKYIHCVALDGEGVFEDNYFSLLPGEERVIRFDEGDKENIIINGYTFKWERSVGNE